MRILTDSSFLSPTQIEKIERRYNGRYVFESQLKLRDNSWSDFPSAIFYTETAHPEGSNWFGVWRDRDKFMISNAISAVEEPFVGIVAENGDVIYSRYRNDFRVSADKTVFIDGGRAHCRHDFEHKLVKLRVSRDRVVVIPTENKRSGFEIPHTEEMDWNLAGA